MNINNINFRYIQKQTFKFNCSAVVFRPLFLPRISYVAIINSTASQLGCRSAKQFSVRVPWKIYNNFVNPVLDRMYKVHSKIIKKTTELLSTEALQF